jgi:hypothetical protein
MNIQEFTTLLFEIEITAHVAHLQTKSFAEHSALGTLYDEISDLRDRFIEDYQGCYEIIRGYKTPKFNEGIDMVTYLKLKKQEISNYRLTLDEGFLQQDIDDILSLISSTLYKLVNLK